jgi:hypothetical protein
MAKKLGGVLRVPRPYDPGENAHFASFSLTAFASQPTKQLSTIIKCVAKTAYDMEHSLSGLDEFWHRMGFYYQKSVNLGPFRVNLSKSGLGYSVGGTGFRVGTTARGKKYCLARAQGSCPLGYSSSRLLSSPLRRLIHPSAYSGPELAIANFVEMATKSHADGVFISDGPSQPPMPVFVR